MAELLSHGLDGLGHGNIESVRRVEDRGRARADTARAGSNAFTVIRPAQPLAAPIADIATASLCGKPSTRTRISPLRVISAPPLEEASVIPASFGATSGDSGGGPVLDRSYYLAAVTGPLSRHPRHEPTHVIAEIAESADGDLIAVGRRPAVGEMFSR
jgi:hypothetical protein